MPKVLALIGREVDRPVPCFDWPACCPWASETWRVWRRLVCKHWCHALCDKWLLFIGLVVDGDLRSKAVDPPVRIRIPDCVSCVPPHKLQDKLERWGVTGRVSCRAGLIEMVVVRAPIILMKNDSSEVSSIETLKVDDSTLTPQSHSIVSHSMSCDSGCDYWGHL